MCRTLRDSLDTFIVSLVAARILYFSNNSDAQQDLLQKTNAILLLSFCFIQLSDAILHYCLKHDLDTLNIIVSKIVVPLILFSEIPVMYWATYKLTGNRTLWFEKTLFVFSILGFILFATNCKSQTVVGDKGFLIWCGDPIKSAAGKLLFFAGIIIATFHYPNNIYKLIFLFVVTSTFIYTFNTDTFGSGWCHFANILSLLFLFTFFSKKYF